MCKRDTSDPLMRKFFDKYGLHLLSIPRANVRVGDVFVHEGSHATNGGTLADFLTEGFELPPATEGEALADVADQMSDSVEASTAVGFLDRFLGAFLPGAGFLDTLKAELAAKRVRAMRFGAVGATRDSITRAALGLRIRKHHLLEDAPHVDLSKPHFVATGVARTRSLTVLTEAERAAGADLDVDALKLAGAKAGLKVEGERRGAVTFQGGTPLAFGVELVSLGYDPATRTFHFSDAGAGMTLRSIAPPAMGRAREGPLANAAFLELAP